jgi:MFS family permease
MRAQHEGESGTPVATDVPLEEPYPRPLYAWYVVGVLTLAYVFSYMDRQILSLLVEPIRRDLEISDTQMSLLMGLSFAVFYTFFGIPLGRLVDSRSRRGIIAAGFALWSVFTAACGLARTYSHLLLLRMGVGVGEAALSPAAYSLISDYMPPQRRNLAISIYVMGLYIGGGLAFILGGIITGIAAAQDTWVLPIVGATRPWQVIFFFVGLPGVLAALLLFTVREPKRRGGTVKAGQTGKVVAAAVPWPETIGYFRKHWRMYLCHNLGFAFLSFSAYGSHSWIPTMFIRNHGWTAAEAGLVYGIVIAVCSALGVITGGWIADRMMARGRADAAMRVGMAVALLWLPTGILFPLMPDASWAVALLIPSAFLASAPFGVAPAAIQQATPNNLRGQASAIYLFVINLIGLGIGPTAVALMTDYVFRNDNAVNYSLVAVTAVAHLLSGLLLWMGLKTFRSHVLAISGKSTPTRPSPVRATA